MTEPSDHSKLVPPHEIAQAIDKLILQISDIHLTAVKYFPQAVEWRKSQIESLIKKGNQLLPELTGSPDQQNNPVLLKNLLAWVLELKRLLQSKIEHHLLNGHFLTLFSIFDAFIGDLIKALYRKQPSLFNAINRQLPISEIITYEKVDNIKELILETEIDHLKRTSYVEIFDSLEKRFDIPTTTHDI